RRAGRGRAWPSVRMGGARGGWPAQRRADRDRGLSRGARRPAAGDGAGLLRRRDALAGGGAVVGRARGDPRTVGRQPAAGALGGDPGCATGPPPCQGAAARPAARALPTTGGPARDHAPVGRLRHGRAPVATSPAWATGVLARAGEASAGRRRRTASA